MRTMCQNGKYIYSPGISEPICMINISGGSETKYYYHFDGLGSVPETGHNTHKNALLVSKIMRMRGVEPPRA